MKISIWIWSTWLGARTARTGIRFLTDCSATAAGNIGTMKDSIDLTLRQITMTIAVMGRDEMDKQTAIDLLDNLLGMVEDNHESDYDTAIHMGIDALKSNAPNALSALDCVERKAAVDAIRAEDDYSSVAVALGLGKAITAICELPSAQPEIIRCKDCIYYDPPHVENNGVRYEYDEMPADAFDALGTGLVNAEYGINIGGRCCVDYYCKNYSDDKRVFVREDNYCGRAERRIDDCV